MIDLIINIICVAWFIIAPVILIFLIYKIFKGDSDGE